MHCHQRNTGLITRIFVAERCRIQRELLEEFNEILTPGTSFRQSRYKRTEVSNLRLADGPVRLAVIKIIQPCVLKTFLQYVSQVLIIQ